MQIKCATKVISPNLLIFNRIKTGTPNAKEQSVNMEEKMNVRTKKITSTLLGGSAKKIARLFAFALCATVLVLSAGCDHPRWVYYDDDCPDCYDDYDGYAPPVPNNVFTVTGDECVRVYWDPVRAGDLAGYRIYRGYSETGYYRLIAEIYNAYLADWDVENGTTYYYAISAYDWWGNESDLSYDLIFDTPRPEGYNTRIYTAEDYPDDAGYDFSEYWVVPYDYPSADVFFGWDDAEGVFYMQAANPSTDILIWGRTSTLDDVDYAPESGWISGGSVDLNTGYSYLVWTSDNHFAHMRIIRLSGTTVTFDWAYQTDTGNPELIVRPQNVPAKFFDGETQKNHTVKVEREIANAQN